MFVFWWPQNEFLKSSSAPHGNSIKGRFVTFIKSVKHVTSIKETHAPDSYAALISRRSPDGGQDVWIGVNFAVSGRRSSNET